jgi:hypothetical protein
MAYYLTVTSTTPAPPLEVLAYGHNSYLKTSIVIDASTIGLNSDGVRELLPGTLLTKNANNQYQRYTGTTTNNVQTVDPPASGTYTLTYSGQTTGAIAFNATPAQVETAIEALSNVTDVEVDTGTGDNLLVTFVDTASPALMTSTGATVAASSATIVGVLCDHILVADGQQHSDVFSHMWEHDQYFRTDRIVDWGTYGTAARAATALKLAKWITPAS